jgi:hypothetical protein
MREETKNDLRLGKLDGELFFLLSPPILCPNHDIQVGALSEDALEVIFRKASTTNIQLSKTVLRSEDEVNHLTSKDVADPTENQHFHVWRSYRGEKPGTCHIHQVENSQMWQHERLHKVCAFLQLCPATLAII